MEVQLCITMLSRDIEVYCKEVEEEHDIAQFLKASVLRKTIKEKEDIVTLLDKAIAKIEEDKRSCSKAVF